jgi:hypothetical protein
LHCVPSSSVEDRMRAFSRWVVGCALGVLALIGCASKNTGFGVEDVGGGSDSGEDAPGTGINVSSSGGNYSGLNLASDGSMAAGNNGPCKGGEYDGTFAGLYTSHLTGVGIPIPVTGNVDMTLEQEGTGQATCMLVGEASKCSDLFSLQDGTITGIADATMVGDATVGGFPYFCTMTGTLDCKGKKLVDGWIQCTYCVGPLADGGMACSLLNGVAGTTGVGGHFAGPLTANYSYETFSFIMGTWNGAESLAGNDGGSPGPEGGPLSNYLSDSGLYLGPGDFGGSGTWNATYK